MVYILFKWFLLRATITAVGSSEERGKREKGRGGGREVLLPLLEQKPEINPALKDLRETILESEMKAYSCVEL